MTCHFIHYLPRQVRMRFPKQANDHWFAVVQNGGDAFRAPRYHTSRRKTGPTRSVRPGDTIWLISQIHSPWGSLPPGIDARIDVERIEERSDGGLRFVAACTSSWFPLFDATPILTMLESVDLSGSPTRICKDTAQPIGGCLQSMRRLLSADSLLTCVGGLRQNEVNFISYRIRDGTACAFRKVRELLNQGEVVFWDRWSLPRRLAERREVVDDHVLDDYLLDQLRQAKTVWGIESPAYSAIGSYSARERAEAIRMNTYRAVDC